MKRIIYIILLAMGLAAVAPMASLVDNNVAAVYAADARAKAKAQREKEKAKQQKAREKAKAKAAKEREKKKKKEQAKAAAQKQKAREKAKAQQAKAKQSSASNKQVASKPAAPKVDNSLLDLTKFPALEACADVVYNPSRTRFLQDAEALGLKTCGGLAMLVAQAYKSSRVFAGDIAGAEALGNPDSDKGAAYVPDEAAELIEKVIKILENRMRNITIIGMPGSGKSLLARNIAAVTGRTLVDLDIAFAEKYGQTPAEVLNGPGEDAFREMECEIAAEFLPTAHHHSSQS